MKLTENTKVRIKVPKHLYEAIQAELAKKEMEEMAAPHDGHEKMEEDTGINEADDKYQAAMEVLNSIPLISSIAKMDPFLAGMTLVGMVTGGTLLGDKVLNGLSYLYSKVKNPKKASELKTAMEKADLDIEDAPKTEPVAEDAQELEETLDFDTLMEAVKDLSKKKAEEKKKKEAEDKKKKEAEAKKKADAKKKK